MNTTVEFRANIEGNIEEITTTTYTPDEWLAKAGEVFRFAQSMRAAPFTALRLEKSNVVALDHEFEQDAARIVETYGLDK